MNEMRKSYCCKNGKVALSPQSYFEIVKDFCRICKGKSRLYASAYDPEKEKDNWQQLLAYIIDKELWEKYGVLPIEEFSVVKKMCKVIYGYINRSPKNHFIDEMYDDSTIKSLVERLHTFCNDDHAFLESEIKKRLMQLKQKGEKAYEYKKTILKNEPVAIAQFFAFLKPSTTSSVTPANVKHIESEKQTCQSLLWPLTHKEKTLFLNKFLEVTQNGICIKFKKKLYCGHCLIQKKLF